MLYDALTHMDAATLGRVCALPAILAFVLLCGWLTERLRQPPAPPFNAIDSSNYHPPTHYIHVVDFDRSNVTICQDGTILARCCMQGCSVEVKIGRDIIGLVVGAELANPEQGGAACV
jgi:hypothetical protein